MKTAISMLALLIGTVVCNAINNETYTFRIYPGTSDCLSSCSVDGGSILGGGGGTLFSGDQLAAGFSCCAHPGDDVVAVVYIYVSVNGGPAEFDGTYTIHIADGYSAGVWNITVDPFVGSISANDIWELPCGQK